jgi:sec-independent protein translocase protein TatB
MNFLGMGPLELMLIVVLALIVFGPAKLPEMMGQIGRAIGDFRRATSELSDEFNRTIQAELNETKQTIEETKSALTEVRSAVDSTVKETRSTVSDTFTGSAAAPQRIAAPSPAVESNGTSHEDSTSNGSAPPLADTSQWSWETSPAAPAEGSTAATEESVAANAEPEGGEVTAEEIATAEVASAAAEPEPLSEPAEGSTPASERVARDELQPPY